VKKSERRGLGRGLSALLADTSLVDAAAGSPPGEAATPDRMVPVELIRPNPDQPRRDFRPEELEELAASIRERGVLQPIILRPSPDNPQEYQIVAGERRWRAAQMAQRHEIPALIRELDDAEVLVFSIIENIQRADLNPVEEAMGYRQLMERFGHTQERLAEAMGKSRSHIANLLRLLNLPEQVQDWLREGRLTQGHAKAALSAPDPLWLATEILRRGLSVREAEKLARKPKQPSQPRAPAPAKDADTLALESDLSAQLGLRVSIEHRGENGGELRIRYRSLDDLDGLCRLLSGG